MLESTFKRKLINVIKTELPNSLVIVNDGLYVQGFPDITIYFDNGKYFLLEVKRDSKSTFRPNQLYYLNESVIRNNALVVYPENLQSVIAKVKRCYTDGI